MKKADIEKMAKNMGYGLTTELCQYTNKKLYVLYLGKHSNGICTIKKGSLKIIGQYLNQQSKTNQRIK